MRRDYFTLDAAGVQADDSGRPIVRITYEGPTEELESRLRRGGTPLDGDGVDITYRLQDALDADTPKGVLAIADRVTGEYVLELNADAEAVLSVTEAVAEGEENNGHYRLVVRTDEGDELAAYEKSTLLIYDHDGELLRERSLIPSGVEI
jgi:NDP-sugar pyrophosphorylase family protein